MRPTERLDKVHSDAGVASRSEIRKMIRSGRILVDGVPANSPESRIDRDAVRILADGKPVNTSRFRYCLMNKPAGVLSVTEDRKQDTVLDLLDETQRKLGLFPVGRLDKDTRGLLLLTNDGDLAHRVISPASGVAKIYIAEVDGIPDEEDVKAFAEGLVLKDGLHCLPAKLELTGGNSCRVTVMEGKYHQVKRMLASRGKPVLQLQRTAIGGLRLDDSLREGTCRELKEEELCKIFNSK
ncbi:MAG: rRNA pseudouridine synthase [Oscillospiraceae bacterium]|nr:rRNA pseudouridine synthase [Oscillospiraceae bacterium]